MAWENANRTITVNLYYSLRMIVEKRQIFLDRFTEGWHNCIGIRISDNKIEEESMIASYMRTEKSGE